MKERQTPEVARQESRPKHPEWMALLCSGDGNKYSTKGSCYSSDHSQASQQCRSSHKHKIDRKSPLLVFKKNQMQGNQSEPPSILKGHFFVPETGGKSGSDRQENGQNRSFCKQQGIEQGDHADKPKSLFLAGAKEDNQVSGMGAKAKDKVTFENNIYSFEREVSCLPQTGFRFLQSCTHQGLKSLTAEAQRKMSSLISRMQLVEDRNRHLKAQLQATTFENQQSYQRVVKLLQEEHQLHRTQAKWIRGKGQLECLCRDVSRKLESQRSSWSQNMGRQECEEYFGGKERHGQASRGSKPVSSGPSSLVQRLQLKAQKTEISS